MKQGLFLIVPDQKDESALIDRFNLFCQKRIPDVLLFQPVCKENAQIRNFIKTVQSHGTAFIFENDIDSAVQLKADGVQIPYSENISDIREQIPEIYLGVVCTNRHEAMIAAEAGADYIKTSTGFAKGGATVEDVALFRKRVGENIRVKAAGGIRTLEAAQAMIEAGADRIGASALVRAAKEAGL